MKKPKHIEKDKNDPWAGTSWTDAVRENANDRKKTTIILCIVLLILIIIASIVT